MFSLRQNLIEKQGVTLESSVKMHLAHVGEAIKANPKLRAHRYRVNENNPNAIGAFVS